jgi:signal transduction histidine kinase
MSNPPSSPLLLQLFRLQEAERLQVGRALHNQVGQALSAIKMGVHLVQSEDDPAQQQEDLQDIIRTCDETVAILRDLHATLHPPQLEAIGLEAALRAEHERVFPGATVALAPLPCMPATDTALVAFRIAQVAMRTVAGAGGTLALGLTGDAEADGGFTVTVDADVEVPSAGLPLLQALAATLGGSVESRGGEHGSRWQLRLPYAPAPVTPTDAA